MFNAHARTHEQDTNHTGTSLGTSWLPGTSWQEEAFYKLRPANKTDHLCLIVPIMAILSYGHETQTVYNVDQNPQMILLSKKGAHGVSSRCEKVGMLLPQRSYGSTLKNHMLLI